MKIILIFTITIFTIRLNAQYRSLLPQELEHLFIASFEHYPDSNFLYNTLQYDIQRSKIKIPISVEILPVPIEPEEQKKRSRKNNEKSHYVEFAIGNTPPALLRSVSIGETDIAPSFFKKKWNDSIVVGISNTNYELLSKLSCMFYKYDTINNTLDALEACCLDFEKYTKTHPDGILQSIEIFSPDMIFICYRDWQEKLNRYVLLQLVGDKVEILPVATAFPFLPPEAYENNNSNPSSNK
ncbi:MAG: hypothetical protein R2798_07955 [Chitinophagales bacterium]|nr:hypothetical protein [Bacteroidota bacterium]MCB9042366.1 hypothetical protein [Chitinophagales bacterium]